MRSQVEQLRVGEVQLLILNFKPTFLRAKSRTEKGGGGAFRFRFPLYLDPPEPQESLFEWDSNSAPFEILRRVALWRAQYDESCKLCSEGYCLSLASMVESVGA